MFGAFPRARVTTRAERRGTSVASPGPSDAALLGDRLDPPESFSAFYRRHVRSVLAFCAKQGLSAHDAADHTSEIFVAAMSSRYRFDPSMGESAVPWLYAIASNVLAGSYRKSARERAAHERLRALGGDLTQRDIAEYAELREDVERALEHIADLPEGQRAAIVGRHLAEADYALLAEQQGVSEQVVRQWVSRGLSTVRDRMGHRS